jgi:hypothetical protein
VRTRIWRLGKKADTWDCGTDYTDFTQSGNTHAGRGHLAPVPSQRGVPLPSFSRTLHAVSRGPYVPDLAFPLGPLRRELVGRQTEQWWRVRLMQQALQLPLQHQHVHQLGQQLAGQHVHQLALRQLTLRQRLTQPDTFWHPPPYTLSLPLSLSLSLPPSPPPLCMTCRVYFGWHCA